ncbi:hypothetical protein [Paenibacillus sp. PvP091]|nr:hypothetical protein [Paenibacillus sp. PvP091]
MAAENGMSVFHLQKLMGHGEIYYEKIRAA